LVDRSALFGEGKTAIGDGIDMAVFLLKRQSVGQARNKIVIVFTDGSNNLGGDPIQAVKDANREGIHVHIVRHAGVRSQR
jgi:Mg-chelatase subunit ChlD